MLCKTLPCMCQYKIGRLLFVRRRGELRHEMNIENWQGGVRLNQKRYPKIVRRFAITLLFLSKQATDIFAAILFYYEGHLFTSIITLAVVFLPGFCIFVTELKRTFCSKPCAIFKATCYLLFSPLWAIVLHLYRFCY